MQALKCAYSKNNYLFHIYVILVNIPTRAYNFKIKRIQSSWGIFTRKNKRRFVYFLIPYNRPPLSRGHLTATIMNHCCYCFDGLWKIKAKNLALCLNAFAKLQNPKGHLRTKFRRPTDRLIVTCLGPMNPLNSLLSVHSRWCAGHEILWPRQRCLLRRKLTWNTCR